MPSPALKMQHKIWKYEAKLERQILGHSFCGILHTEKIKQQNLSKKQNN